VKIYVFDVDKLSRRVLDRTWPNLAAKKAENDPNLASQDEPKIDQNRTQNESKMKTIFKSEKIVFKSLLEPSWADLGAFWEASWGSQNRCGIGRRSVW